MAITSKKFHAGDSDYARRDSVGGTDAISPLAEIVSAWQRASTVAGGAGRQFLTYRGLNAYADFQRDWGSLALNIDTSGILSETVLAPGSGPTGPRASARQDVRTDLTTLWLDLAVIAWRRIGVRNGYGPGKGSPNALIVTYLNAGNADLVISKAGYDGAYHYYHWEIENP